MFTNIKVLCFTKTMTKISLMSSVICLLLGGCGTPSQPGPQNEVQELKSDSKPVEVPTQVVKIGHVAPVSGILHYLGQDNENGARLAIEELNAENIRIGGQYIHFELVTEDDQASPPMAVPVAQHLVDAGVVGVVGHLNSSTSILASPVYAEAGIPQISPSATADHLTEQGFHTTFRLIAKDSDQGRMLADFSIKQLHARRIVIVDDRTAYAVGVANAYAGRVDALRRDGALNVSPVTVSRQYTEPMNFDLRKLVAKIKSADPDVVLFGGMDIQAARLLQEMRAQNVTATLLGADGMQTGEFIKRAGAIAEDQYATQPGSAATLLPGFSRFRKKYEARFHLPVYIYSPYTYDAVKLLVTAMRQSDSVDPKQYINSLAQIDYEGVSGHLSFEPTGDLAAAVVSIYQVQHGKWVLIKQEKVS